MKTVLLFLFIMSADMHSLRFHLGNRITEDSRLLSEKQNLIEVINIFANIPYLLTVHHTHKLGGHNCP